MRSSFADLFRLQRFAGQRRLLLLCVVLFCFSSVVSFWWFFPAEIIQRRLVRDLSQKTGLQMQGYNASMAFPLGLNFALLIEPSVTELNPMRFDWLRVTPRWRTLFSKDPAAHIEGEISSGRFFLNAGRNGDLDLTFRDLELLPLQRQENAYRLDGSIQGLFSAEQFAADMQGRGDFSVEISRAALLGLEKIGLPRRFDIGVLIVDGKFSQRRVSLEKIVSSEGALELSGGGTLLVGDNPEQTRLNLNVRIHPNSATPEGLRDLIRLTGVRPTADGSYLLRIGGTLAKPVVR